DSGGLERENCVEVPILPGPIHYEWTIIKPDGSTVSGSGSAGTVLADQPGTYSCTFTAETNRDCAPQESYTVGPEMATVPPVTCDAQLSDGGGSQGDTIQLPLTITNTSSCEVTFDWQVTTSGAPTVTPNPASGSITLQQGQSRNTPLSVQIAANSATGTETLTLTVTSGGTTVCNDTATVTVCDQCETFNGTQCEPKPLCTSCTPQGSTTCSPPGYACDGSGACERGQNLIAQIVGQLGLTYANQSTSGCLAGRCGAGIQFDVTGVTHSCDSIDMAGATVTETATNDHGCVAVNVQTGPGCGVNCGNAINNCTDTYQMCALPSSYPPGGCTETVTQHLYVDGHLVETHTIIFTITFPGGTCTGSVTRN
ncbi:MAG: hypothetical protein JSU86_05935, partial [Phycisphaerales bacterium]